MGIYYKGNRLDGGTSLTPDETLTMSAENVLGVATPVQRVLTQEEFDALPEDEQKKGLYVIPGGGSGGATMKIILNGEVVEAGAGVPIIQALEIKTPPDKTAYSSGETFDPTGMVVSAVYEGGLSKSVTGYTFSPDGPLSTGTESVTISYTENGFTVTVEQPISVIIKIYGVSWDGTATTKWSRTDQAVGFTDPVPYVNGSTEYGSPFDNLMPWAGMVKEERAGGTMVAIPKFWYKLTQNGAGMTIQIANEPIEGFSVSPAHMNRGDGKGERDVVYIGRYHCAADYKSKTGVKPIINVTCSYGRAEIHKLGSNIWQSDFAMRFTIWLLYLVEFADWNSQNTIGYGCGDDGAVGVGNMGYTDSMPYHTGTTKSNRYTYGFGTQYRNIEGLWDNVSDWIDGCYYNNSGLNIILNPNNFVNADNQAGGVLAGTCSNGFPSRFAVRTVGFPCFTPTEPNGNASTYSCDYWEFTAPYRVLYGGGNYSEDSYHGLFYIKAESASVPSGTIGSRLQELP